MLFLEPWFWIFAAVAIPVYWLCPQRLKIYWLVLASAVFHYHFAGPAGVIPIIVLGTITYFAALGLSTGHIAKRGFVAASAIVVGALAFYKYSAFVIDNFQALIVHTSMSAPTWMQDWHNPAAPLAISFFTFEFVHYLYEVRVNHREPIRNPVHFAGFAIFFPSLACGPIKRFPDFVPQLTTLRTPTPAAIWPAAQRVIRGLFKKVCIADVLVEYTRAFETVAHFTAPIVVALAIVQGFRIYYDFAGYTDIAIGLAQLMGLRIPENFYRPYWSTSLQEFWRRWHMSLSLWIRDYVYIPLGGNRAHRVLNLLAAMILVGLWHGAAWNFAAWGVYHGAGLSVEAGVRRWKPGLFGSTTPNRLLRWAVCYSFVTFGWLIFFYPLSTVYKMSLEALRWCFES